MVESARPNEPIARASAPAGTGPDAGAGRRDASEVEAGAPALTAAASSATCTYPAASDRPVPITPPKPLDQPPGRPPTRAWRFMKAYWVTFIVIASYLSVKLQARFRSQAAIERLIAQKHIINARRVRRTILALQGLFVKVGQLISIMTNFLPAEFRQELEGLQDQVPPRPYRDIEARFREEFGGRLPKELFAEFDERPIAAASIGQVHFARLKTGEPVAVKVQYPDIEAIARRDLRTLRRILHIVEYFIPYHGLDAIYREVRDMIMEELDFRVEAENVQRIASHFPGRDDVAFPLPVTELSTVRVLTTQWEEGTRIGDVERLDANGIDRKALARLVVEAYCQQIFVDGVYHADPHPGNLLVRACPAKPGAPCVVFLDFGAVAQVSPKMRQGIVEFLQGVIHRDTARIVKAMREMGFIARTADDRVLDRVVEYFHGRFEEQIHLESFNLKELKLDPQDALESLFDLRKMNISLHDVSDAFHVPKEWILLERTLLLLTGLCTALHPEMNPMSVVRPYLERFVLGPDEDWSKFVVNTGKELVLSALALPGEMRRFMTRTQRGELEFSLHNLEESARLVYTLGHQLIYTAVGITSAVLAVVLTGKGDAYAASVAWKVCGGAGFLLVGSMWLARNRLKRKRKRQG